MKIACQIHSATSSFAIRLTLLFAAAAAFAGLATGAVTPDSKPRDWPANPAKHQVMIHRVAADKQQSDMIAAAEAAQPSKEALKQAAAEAAVPTGEKVWWYEEKLGIRIPCAITAAAVAYYSDLVGNYGKQGFKRYVEPSSRLDYHAGVAFHEKFKQGEKTFSNVHVVTLKLTFSQNFAATETEGMHFQKERMVILDAGGKMLHISGDGPTEAPILAI